MSIEKKLLGTSPSGKSAPNVEDVFSTYLYEGNNSTQTITNGIDLDGEDGMVWIKDRDLAKWHKIFDTSRGVNKALFTNETDSESTVASTLTSFNANGFALGAGGAGNNNSVNENTKPYTSWTFRKAPRFFDVVKYTGNGVAGREIPHDLGVAPGMMIVKNLELGTEWQVYHRSMDASNPETYNMYLNASNQRIPGGTMWDTTAPTSTVFTVGNGNEVNRASSLNTYIAYLFAHDPVGENDDGMIACGSWESASTYIDVNVELGWEPQYLLYKSADSAGGWYVSDNMRGTGAVKSNDTALTASTSDAEFIMSRSTFHATGFTCLAGSLNDTFIYMAIRAPMMKEPEAGSEVFATDSRGSTGDGLAPTYRSGFPVDFTINCNKDYAGHNTSASSRLTGTATLWTNLTTTEGTDPTYSVFDYMNGHGTDTGTNLSQRSWMFKRAKGFFDVVAYTGNGTFGRTVNHSLGVVPEMVWVKNRSNTQSWQIYNKDIPSTPVGSGGRILLDTSAGFQDSDSYWADTDPTSAVFSVGDGDPNVNSNTYVAYLFASLDGISKVGSYTGNGSNQNIACGFSAGARFVLIKRTDNNSDWYIWDTERGIVTGNDPHLSLNTTSAEVTTDDSIDPQSAGFTVNQVSATNINVSSATYIFLAIA